MKKWAVLWGWGGATSVVIGLFVLFIHDFLSITDTVPANVLVVEGWAWGSAAMQEAAEEFKRGRYDVVVTVGTLPGTQNGVTTLENSAVRAAERLKKFGVAEGAIAVLAIPNIDQHRTYTSALAVKQWQTRTSIHVTGMNVFTLGAHARKSLVLFQRAFGQSMPVGVIAGTEDSYDPARWWASVRGVYTVLRKTVGYLYAKYWPLPVDLPVISKLVSSPTFS